MDPTIEDPDAQFAVFVADLHAHADDPIKGKEKPRAVPGDAEELHALWDCAWTVTTGPATPLSFAVVGYTLVLVVAAFAVFYTKVGPLQ